MFESVKCGSRVHLAVGGDDICLFELLDGKTSAPREVKLRLADLGFIHITGPEGRTRWALTAKGRQRATDLRHFEARLRQHYSGATTAGGCALQCVSRPSFTMAPRSRRMS